MKLARPNVFHPRIVLASCRQLPGGDGDDDGVVAALRGRGLNARWLPWDDPETESADLVILRAAWDYADRRDEFLGHAKQDSADTYGHGRSLNKKLEDLLAAMPF